MAAGWEEAAAAEEATAGVAMEEVAVVAVVGYPAEEVEGEDAPLAWMAAARAEVALEVAAAEVETLEVVGWEAAGKEAAGMEAAAAVVEEAAEWQEAEAEGEGAPPALLVVAQVGEERAEAAAEAAAREVGGWEAVAAEAAVRAEAAQEAEEMAERLEAEVEGEDTPLAPLVAALVVEHKEAARVAEVPREAAGWEAVAAEVAVMEVVALVKEPQEGWQVAGGAALPVAVV